MKVVILAGGSGERFWPASTASTPKQFLRLFSEKTLIRLTFERFKNTVEPENIVVVTSKDHVRTTADELPEIPEKNIIGEPFRRNTAPACFLGTLTAKDDETVFVVPADHKIPDESAFLNVMKKAAERLEEKPETIITFGISPSRPETGYGYIEASEKITESVYRVGMFHEKPDVDKARFYISKGNCYWNGGMFMWKRNFFLAEMKKHEIEVYSALNGTDPFCEEEISRAYETLKPISIDYALMEKSKSIEMVAADFEWSDLGSWKSIMDLEGTTIKPENLIDVDCKNIFLRTKTGKPVVVIGLSDLIIVENENGLLICREDASQNVREAVKKIKNQIRH